MVQSPVWWNTHVPVSHTSLPHQCLTQATMIRRSSKIRNHLDVIWIWALILCLLWDPAQSALPLSLKLYVLRVDEGSGPAAVQISAQSKWLWEAACPVSPVWLSAWPAELSSMWIRWQWGRAWRWKCSLFLGGAKCLVIKSKTVESSNSKFWC